LAADVRAATPSNAAEIVTPHRLDIEKEIVRFISAIEESLIYNLENRTEFINSSLAKFGEFFRRRGDFLTHTINLFEKNSGYFVRKLADRKKEITQIATNLEKNTKQVLAKFSQNIGFFQTRLQNASPEATLKRGYSITRFSETGKVVKRTSELKKGAKVNTKLKKGEFSSQVIN
ncbi:MAG: hypothetical protein ACD_68C00043G0001, partial [uncultured bacterium]